MDIQRRHTPPTEATTNPQERMNMRLDQEHYDLYGSFSRHSEHYQNNPDGWYGTEGRSVTDAEASRSSVAPLEHWGKQDNTIDPRLLYAPDSMHAGSSAAPLERGRDHGIGPHDFYRPDAPADASDPFNQYSDRTADSGAAIPQEPNTATESRRRLQSPGGTIHDLNPFRSYQDFVQGPGTRKQDGTPRPSDEQLRAGYVGRLLSGERGRLKRWSNADEQPYYQPASDRREAARKANETMGPEGRSAATRKANETRGSEGRREAARKANETRGSEGRREAARKAKETMGSEGRREAVRKAWETRRKQRDAAE